MEEEEERANKDFHFRKGKVSHHVKRYYHREVCPVPVAPSILVIDAR